MGSSLNAGVIIVLLRRPYRHQSDERRDDPFWEFGSFGCTGCHRTNLMNPRRSHELVGKHLAVCAGWRSWIPISSCYTADRRYLPLYRTKSAKPYGRRPTCRLPTRPRPWWLTTKLHPTFRCSPIWYAISGVQHQLADLPAAFGVAARPSQVR